MLKLFSNNFWDFIARKILRNKIGILLTIVGVTILLSTQWKYMRFTYAEANLLPDDHEVNIKYNEFLKVFGEEGNLIVLGVKDSSLFTVEKLNAWNNLSESFKNHFFITHFFNPPRYMKLVEIISNKYTDNKYVEFTIIMILQRKINMLVLIVLLKSSLYLTL